MASRPLVKQNSHLPLSWHDFFFSFLSFHFFFLYHTESAEEEKTKQKDNWVGKERVRVSKKEGERETGEEQC